MTEKPITASMEDYLEAIFDLHRDRKAVRVKDIAGKLSVRMPSVTSMLKSLNERGLVKYEKYETVRLTELGLLIGKEMRRKHDAIRKFLTDVLKIELGKADQEACRIEHALSSETLDRLADFIDFIYTCPRAGEGWLCQYEEYLVHGGEYETCGKNSKDIKKPS